MNVCVVAEYYPRRRDPVLGVWAHEQALAARDAGAEVRVLALERPIPPLRALPRPAALAGALKDVVRQPRHEQRDGLEVEYVRFVSPPRDSSYLDWDRWARPPLERALTRLDRERPIDLVHAHYALPAGAAAGPWAAKRRRPLVISVHGGDLLGPLMKGEAGRTRVSEVLETARVVLCNSEETKRRAVDLTRNADPMRVVHLGARAPEGLKPKHEQPTIATLAHLDPRKRHEDVLRALAHERLRDARWVVIGDGPERDRLEGLAVELEVADRVDWLGQLDHDDSLRELGRCHVMALPSVDEAFGVAYVESLVCGVPAIASEGEGGPAEIAAAGEGLVLVPPKDPAALAETLAGLLDDRERLEGLAAAGRATAERHFSWERCGRQTVAIYQEALG